MIRLILVAFFLIAFLILSAIPLLIGEYLIYKNDEKKPAGILSESGSGDVSYASASDRQ